MYVTSLDHPEYSDRYNIHDGYRHPIVLHKNWSFHLGRFPSMEKLEEFMRFAGLALGELVEEKHMGLAGMYRQWRVDTEIDDRGFSDMKDFPEDAKAFTGLSNGSLVTCYLWNDGILHIRRPNPNDPTIYKPLNVEDHIRHCRENGYV